MTPENTKTANKIAKSLAAEFCEKLKKGNSSIRISFYNRLGITTYCQAGKPSRTVYKFAEGVEFPYTDSVSDLYEFSNAVKGEFWKRIEKKMKKGMLLFHRTETKRDKCSCWWSTAPEYEVWDGVTVIRPCKEWGKLCKRIESLGLPPIDPRKWNVSGVFGKRSSYHVTNTSYRCASPENCTEVLDFLKGRKKATYEYKRHEDMRDREYGERYETEWSGAIYNTLRIVLGDGKSREFGW